jgi:multicomponent Na+:H+ antiporter subunit E
MARLVYGAGLVVVWVLAWGTASPANVLGGIAVAAFLLAISPDRWPARHGRHRFRPVAIARFVGWILVQVVVANVQLTRAIVSRATRVTTGVIAVPLPSCSDGLLTLVTNTMALTPGTIPIQVDHDPTVMYVHVLHRGDVEAVRGDVRHLASLAYRAFGTAEAVAAMEALERQEVAT